MQDNLDNEIRVLSKEYKNDEYSSFYCLLDFILQDSYTNKYQNLRLFLNKDTLKTLYSNFISHIGIEDMSQNVIFRDDTNNSCLARSGIYDIDGKKKVVIRRKSNINDLYKFVGYTSVLHFLNNGNDEIVSYIKSMLLCDYLIDYLKDIGYPEKECEKLKMHNFMKIIYKSIIINCSIRESKSYIEGSKISQDILDETRQKLKRCIDYEKELSRYNFVNSKKYIYGIAYSTYLHQKFINDNNKGLLEFLNTSMDLKTFSETFDINSNSNKVYEYYNREYRSSYGNSNSRANGCW